MAELRERPRQDIDQWFGGSYFEHAVIAASEYETGANEALHTGTVISEAFQHVYDTNFKTLAKLRALPRVSWTKLDREILDTLVEVIKTHADTIAAQLEITPEQLYSMTFADFIATHEQSKGSEESSEGKSLTQRLAEAYDEEARAEDERFLRNVKAYYRHRYSNED